MDKGQARPGGAGLVHMGITHIDRVQQAVSPGHQADIFRLAEPGTAGAFIVPDIFPKPCVVQKALDIALLAVADDIQPADACQSLKQFFHAGVKLSAVDSDVGIFMVNAVPADGQRFPAVDRKQRLRDLIHRHAHDATDILLRRRIQAAVVFCQGLRPTGGNGPAGVPKGAVQVKDHTVTKQSIISHTAPDYSIKSAPREVFY